MTHRDRKKRGLRRSPLDLAVEKGRLRALGIFLLAAGLWSGLQSAAYAQQVLTFSMVLANKLFIGAIEPSRCRPEEVVGEGGAPASPARVAAYMALCLATSLRENPPSPQEVSPLDARILGGVRLQWRCRAGDEIPTQVGFLAPLPTRGGAEGPAWLGIEGSVNPTATRNDLMRTGDFAYVVSGHPNSILEPAFQIQRPRQRPDIWARVVGKVRCADDGRGMPEAIVDLQLEHTLFPSHRLWRAPALEEPAVQVKEVEQRHFSDLWFLPPIPQP